MAIKTVAVAGGTGSVGKAIIETLVSSNFEVTLLVREEKPSPFGPSVKTTKVDYDSHQSLVSALQGIDALISVMGGAGLHTQPALVDAAIEAGVSRFLPSEFGANTDVPLTGQIPIFHRKVEFREWLAKKAAENPSLSYSFVVQGPFFDYCVSAGFFADLKNQEITLYDGGENKFSTTCLSDLGTVVVGILRNPEETKNRSVYVEGANMTQNQLVAILEKVTGSTWTKKQESISELNAAMFEEMKKEKPSPGVFFPGFLKVIIFGGSAYGADLNEHTPGLDNDLVGLKRYSEEDLEQKVRDLITKS